jgi:hypothetical protein
VSQNYHVRRLLAKFAPHLTLDPKDAGEFADTVLECAQLVEKWGTFSASSRRSLNLALCYLDMKYPFMCCGKSGKDADSRCQDCPMRGQDLK